MDYVNFDLRIGEWDSVTRRAVVEVLHSPAGESNRMGILLDIDAETGPTCRYSTPASAREVGVALARSVLVDQVQSLWHESRQIARVREQGLRLRLHLDSPELTLLPWELLYDERQNDFVVFDERVSVVRYMRLQTAPPALKPSESFTVMALVASPTNAVPLDTAAELRNLRAALADLIQALRVRLVVCEHATLSKLSQMLLEHAPDIVHFIGHASFDHETQQGLLVLEDEQARAAPLAAQSMARLLRQYGGNLVVLNACQTAVGAWAGLGPALVRADIPAVVAMQWPVEDRAATAFTRAFYSALSLGRTIDECVASGRVGVNVISDYPSDWGAPVLFLRSDSGCLWMNGRHGYDPGAGLHQDVRQAPVLRDEGVHEPRRGQHQALFKTHGPLRAPGDRHLIIERGALRQALRTAQQPSVTQYIALLSPRQTGKTTFLLQLMDRLRDTYACVFVDLAMLRAQDAQTSFRLLAFRLTSALGSMLGPGYPLPDTAHIQNPVEFLEFLEALARATPISRILLLVDEVGALAPEAADVFFNALRSVFTQGRSGNDFLAKYLFVFSGAVDLYGLTSGTTSPLNICEKIYLEDFEVADVRRLLGLFGHLGIPVAKDAAERVYARTEGHPYLTMRVCALMEASGVAQVTAEAIEAAVEQMLVEDDNIRHVIGELEQSPLGRRRLYELLVEKRRIAFTRNDPVLAALEMLGVIRAAQPCRVRNSIYAASLLPYLQAYANGSRPS